MSELKALAPSATRREAIADISEAFRLAGVEAPRREAGLALRAACALTELDLLCAPEAPLGPAATRLNEFVKRRLRGEPLSRVTGAREFWGLLFSITPDVLDPRPETETVVEAAVALFAERRTEPLRIVDLGVGSGALLCALLSEFRSARGLGIDVSPAAASVAIRNVEACGLSGRAEIRVGDWNADLEGPFDLIVSNPPYVRTADIAALPCAVRDFDPLVALNGGGDGLDAYRGIFPAAQLLLAADGFLLAEMGHGQAAEVLEIAARAGFHDCALWRDYAGIDRVIAARAPAAAGRGLPRAGQYRDGLIRAT